MFTLKLAISTGWTIEYVESLSIKTIRELQALNAIEPFLYQHQTERECITATLIHNSTATKKRHMKSVTDMFPYMRAGVPDEFEDEVVLKARRILESMKFTLSGEEHPGMKDFRERLREQIEIETSSDTVDKYRVGKLKKLLTSINS